MFNCNQCGKTTKPGEPANKIVVATRAKTYRNAVKLKPIIDEETGEERPAPRPRRDDKKRQQYVESFGTEIVREIQVCNKCAGHEDNPQVKVVHTSEPDQRWWSPGSLPGIQV